MLVAGRITLHLNHRTSRVREHSGAKLRRGLARVPSVAARQSPAVASRPRQPLQASSGCGCWSGASCLGRSVGGGLPRPRRPTVRARSFAFSCSVRGCVLRVRHPAPACVARLRKTFTSRAVHAPLCRAQRRRPRGIATLAWSTRRAVARHTSCQQNRRLCMPYAVRRHAACRKRCRFATEERFRR